MRPSKTLFILMALLTYAHADGPPKRTPPATRVEAHQIQAARLIERALLRGKAQPMVDLILSAESAGRIEEMPVEIGQRLAKKDLVARVDFKLQRAQVKQAQAAYTLAKATLGRLEALLKEEMTTAQQVDQARAQVQQAKASLELAKVQRGHSTVRAPMGGIVVQKMLDEKEYAGPGAPLIRLLNDDTIRLIAHAPERQVARLHPKMPAVVRFAGLDGSVEGQIHLILPIANPQSHTFEVHLHLDNPQHRIMTGMAAEVEILLAEHRGVVIPQDWVVEAEGARVAFVVEGEVARRRVVEIGASAEGRVLISKGLEVGERVVTSGQRSLRDGQRVKVIKR